MIDLTGPTPGEQLGTQDSLPSSQPTTVSQITDEDLSSRMAKLIEESKAAQAQSIATHSEEISKVKSDVTSAKKRN